MKPSQIAYLCAACDLGTPLTEPQPVMGGLLHHVWRLSTARGTYAVKQLNPAIMRKPGIGDAYQVTEQIAAAMAAQKVPAVAAITCQDDPLLQSGGATFLVYKWIEGEVLPLDPVEPERARQIGAILAHMHSLSLQLPGMVPHTWDSFHDDDWDMLTFHAADKDLPWAYGVRAALPKIAEWSNWYKEAGKTLSQTLVVSHRDLDQKSVIWQDAHTPNIIDWEAAGLVNPTMELVGVALAWSGMASGAPDEDIFSAVMEGYVKAGGIVRDPGIDALHGLMGTRLGWLLFNMRRSMGESIASEDERQLGMRETTNTLSTLRSLANHCKKWAMWLDKWRV